MAKSKEKIIENIMRDLKLRDEEAEYFYDNALRYIKATKEGRVICIIDSVSKSGMIRHMKFLECHRMISRYHYLNFYTFFRDLGWGKVKDTDYFRIVGCGMDMVFNTNYNNMHDLKRLGFISKNQCETLAQMTPTVA